MTQRIGCAIRGGPNIAMKVPPHRYEATVAFYRDVLALPIAVERDGSIAFTFGAVRLWIDRVECLSQAELWLELTTDDTGDRRAPPGARGHSALRWNRVHCRRVSMAFGSPTRPTSFTL